MIEGHGDDSYKYERPMVSNFSSNICCGADLSGLKEHLCRRMEVIASYPEPEPYTLERELAACHRVRPDEVCVTNGATEAIYLIAQTFRETNSAILQPTFNEYADACRMHGHRVTSLFCLPAEAGGYRLPEEVRMFWLCNPNNPTGTVASLTQLRELVVRNPEVCFVIDQSYESFTLRPLFSVNEAAALPNVLLLHSMTKRYAIPGLRLGYVTGNEGLLHRLRTNRMPWSVNQLAVEAGRFLLRNAFSGKIPFSPSMPDLPSYLQETTRLRRSLQSLGALDVWESDTHFMLVCLRFGKASALKEYLAEEHGILIRDASNFQGLDGRFFRIATQSPEENDRLVGAIRSWLME